MESKALMLEFKQFSSKEELPESERELLEQAMQATQTAYAPYSQFRVGAAVLLENGTIVRGSNQENAAYPSGLCAERVALFAAASQYPGIKIKAIAVSALIKEKPSEKAVSPCGDCRQVMAEYEHRYQTNIRLIMPGEGKKILVCDSVKTLLPFMFNSDHLK